MIPSLPQKLLEAFLPELTPPNTPTIHRAGSGSTTLQVVHLRARLCHGRFPPPPRSTVCLRRSPTTSSQRRNAWPKRRGRRFFSGEETVNPVKLVVGLTRFGVLAVFLGVMVEGCTIFTPQKNLCFSLSFGGGEGFGRLPVSWTNGGGMAFLRGRQQRLKCFGLRLSDWRIESLLRQKGWRVACSSLHQGLHFLGLTTQRQNLSHL